MSAFYTEMAATALELLTEFGSAVTITRTTGQSVDPVTGAVTPGTTVNLATTGLLTKYPDKFEEIISAAANGTRIMTGDRTLILSNEVEPLLTDNPVIGGESWSVVSIETVKPTSVAIVYFVQVTK